MTAKRALRIGLTGGIASGKSLVANIFVQYGADLIDTDAIAREVVAPGTPGLAAIIDAFGQSALAADGSLDRPAMRARIFANPEERSRLEALLHPLIRKTALERADHMTGPYTIFAVPLLIETDFHELVDRICVVDCEQAQQLERLTARDQISHEQAMAMLEAQSDRDRRLQAADDVIDNRRSIPETRAQVYRLHRRYLEIRDDCRTGPAHAE